MTTSYILAIDYGTTSTTAATSEGGALHMVEFAGASRVPSVVLLTGSGELAAGQAAADQSIAAPDRLEWTPKRRLGDRTVLLGDQSVAPADMAAATLRLVADEAIRRHDGTAPTQTRLTYPARWAGRRARALVDAAARAGLPGAVLIPEPIAAAIHLGSERVEVGQLVAVYDLGGGTFDTAVLRRVEDGFEAVGAPGGIDRLGGEDFDERLYTHVGQTIAARHPDAWENLLYSEDRTWTHANHALRTQVRSAKEALSSSSDFTIYVGAGVDIDIRVTREEFEAMIAPDVSRSIDELMATIARAGVGPADLADVYLVGGSSRVPLVSRELAKRLDRLPTTWGDPKAAVVLGAASAAPMMFTNPDDAGAAQTVPIAATPEALPTPVDTDPVQAYAADNDDATDPAGSPSRSKRNLLLVLAACVVALLAIGGFLATRFGQGDEVVTAAEDPETEPISVEPGDVSVDREPIEIATGITAEETFVLRAPDGAALTAEVALVNTTTEPVVVNHIEVIPKSWAATVAEVDFASEPTEVIEADPIVRWEVELAPGGETRIVYDVQLEPAGATDAALQGHIATRDAARVAFTTDHPWAQAFAAFSGAPMTSLTWIAPAAGVTDPTTGGSTIIVGGDPNVGKPDPGTDPGNNDGGYTGPTVTQLAAPGNVGNVRAQNPSGGNGNVSVSVTWSAPSSGGAPSGYRVRATTYGGDNNPQDGCDGTAQAISSRTYETGSTGGTFWSYTSPACSWVVWEVQAFNSTASAGWVQGAGVIPNIRGNWAAFEYVRAVGGMAVNGGQTSCGVEISAPCSTNVTGTIAPGTAVGIVYQS